MVPIHKKKWIENVAKLADKTVTSSRVAFTLSSAAFMPDVSGQKKMLQDDIVASTSTLHRCREELRKTSAKNIKDMLSSSGFIRSGKIRGKHIFFEMVRESQGKSGNSTKKSGKSWKKSGRFFWKVLISYESRSIVF